VGRSEGRSDPERISKVTSESESVTRSPNLRAPHRL
jgi:hypothetical protein